MAVDGALADSPSGDPAGRLSCGSRGSVGCEVDSLRTPAKVTEGFRPEPMRRRLLPALRPETGPHDRTMRPRASGEEANVDSTGAALRSCATRPPRWGALAAPLRRRRTSRQRSLLRSSLRRRPGGSQLRHRRLRTTRRGASHEDDLPSAARRHRVPDDGSHLDLSTHSSGIHTSARSASASAMVGSSPVTRPPSQRHLDYFAVIASAAAARPIHVRESQLLSVTPGYGAPQVRDASLPGARSFIWTTMTTIGRPTGLPQPTRRTTRNSCRMDNPNSTGKRF